MLKAVRIIKFDAAHRIVGHEGKCRNIHGHRFEVHFYAEAFELDDLGRVVDFSRMKELLGGWIDRFWDHNIIVWNQDTNVNFLKSCDAEKEIYVTDFNPTAENLANYLLETICPKILENEHFTISRIVFFETENCFVDVSRKDTDGNK